MNATRKVAIITGASGGIGTALVKAYRAMGYAVAATGRTKPPSSDPGVLALAADVAEPGSGARLVDATVERFGRVDTLIHSAGLFVSKPFTEYTDEDYERVTGVNVRGFFEVSRSVISAMLARDDGGHIVNISTSLVDNADAMVPAALASLTKGGLNGVTKSLAIEYATRGIRVNAVALGVIRTPMHPTDPDGFQAARHPVRRMGEVDDVVRAVLYLEQAPFVTGEISHVDGGQSAGH
ncbi:SDR family NAD(P)-dependent oxidoreductase [Streptomyces sp. NPDC057428]|uniref:SDR family NAD(P)-dependent oxidoreductase n=1 Tax=Streptomyces sp. NPDC057428 TaxID=3346129 RepID=UPI0036C53431